MLRKLSTSVAALFVSACATQQLPPQPAVPTAAIEVQILAQKKSIACFVSIELLGMEVGIWIESGKER